MATAEKPLQLNVQVQNAEEAGLPVTPEWELGPEDVEYLNEKREALLKAARHLGECLRFRKSQSELNEAEKQLAKAAIRFDVAESVCNFVPPKSQAEAKPAA
jgi:hypothetical protein